LTTVGNSTKAENSLLSSCHTGERGYPGIWIPVENHPYDHGDGMKSGINQYLNKSHHLFLHVIPANAGIQIYGFPNT
jgi:hypothetical protein